MKKHFRVTHVITLYIDELELQNHHPYASIEDYESDEMCLEDYIALKADTIIADIIVEEVKNDHLAKESIQDKTSN